MRNLGRLAGGLAMVAAVVAFRPWRGSKTVAECAAGVGDACERAGALREKARDLVDAEAFAMVAANLYNRLAGVRDAGEKAEMLARSDAASARACDLGAARSCLWLGNRIDGSGGRNERAAETRRWYERACTLGEKKGCVRAATMLASGDGVARDTRRGLAQLDTFCNDADASACDVLGRIHEWGFEHYTSPPLVPVDVKKAESYYRRECALYDGYSCHRAEVLRCRREDPPVDVHSTLLADFMARAEVDPCDDPFVLRMEMDITGDGVPELFLESSSQAGNAGQSWVIYAPTGHNRFRFLATHFFHWLAFDYTPATHLFTQYDRLSASEGSISSFRMDASGVRPISGPLDAGEEGPGLIARWQKRGPRHVWGIRLHDLVRTDHPVWERDGAKQAYALGALD